MLHGSSLIWSLSYSSACGDLLFGLMLAYSRCSSLLWLVQWCLLQTRQQVFNDPQNRFRHLYGFVLPKQTFFVQAAHPDGAVKLATPAGKKGPNSGCLLHRDLLSNLMVLMRLF